MGAEGSRSGWEPDVPPGVQPETPSQVPRVCRGLGEGRGSPGRPWKDTQLLPLCSDESSEPDFGAEAMRPRCLTESRQPGTKPCACRSRQHPVPGASGSSPAELAWQKPLYRRTPSAPKEMGTPQRPGDGAAAVRGHVARSQPPLPSAKGDLSSPPATAGQLCTSPGCHRWLGRVAVAGRASHRGILWQASFPKAPWLFNERGELRCSPPPHQ